MDVVSKWSSTSVREESTMFKKILVTTDGSSLAEEAVPMAIELARAGGGEIRIVSVVGPGIAFGVQSPGMGFYNTEASRRTRAEIEAEAYESAERIKTAATAAGLVASVSLRSGVAVKEILAEARAWKADVIVMSTHGRRGIVRALLGSCAAEVVQSSTCPVLLHRLSAPNEEGVGTSG